MDAAHWQRIEKVAMEFHEFSPTHRHGELVSILRDNGFSVEVNTNRLRYSILKAGEIWATRSSN